MKTRNSHVQKQVADRTTYQSELGKLNPEPTVDEILEFDSSNKIKREKKTSYSNKKRPTSTKSKFLKFISQNIVAIILTIFSIVSTVFFAIAVFYFIDARVAIGTIQEKINIQQQQLERLSLNIDDNDSESKEYIQSLQNNLDEIQEEIDNSNKTNNSQDILLNEIKQRLDEIFDEIEKLKANK